MGGNCSANRKPGSSSLAPFPTLARALRKGGREVTARHRWARNNRIDHDHARVRQRVARWRSAGGHRIVLAAANRGSVRGARRHRDVAPSNRICGGAETGCDTKKRVHPRRPWQICHTFENNRLKPPFAAAFLMSAGIFDGPRKSRRGTREHARATHAHAKRTSMRARARKKSARVSVGSRRFFSLRVNVLRNDDARVARGELCARASRDTHGVGRCARNPSLRMRVCCTQRARSAAIGDRHTGGKRAARGIAGSHGITRARRATGTPAHIN